MIYSKAMKKQLKNTFYQLLPPFLSILIILTSVGLFYYIKGYRFNFQTKQVSTTGILSIDTIPPRSNLYIGEKEYGKTPKSVTLPGGEYLLKIERDGYNSWQKNVSIIEEKSSSVYPWLIARDIKEQTIFSSSKILNANSIYQTESSIFFILYEEESDITSYELWKLKTKSSAWDFTSNPTKILTFSTNNSEENSYNLLPSPDSSIVLFSLITNSDKDKYIVETNKENSLDKLTPIVLNGFSKYSISWNNSNKELFLESDIDIFSYDLNTNITYLITKKIQDTLYSFTSDKTGLVYLMTGLLEEDIYEYSLLQYLPTGTFQKEVIPNIYFYNSEEYIKSYREDPKDLSLPFKNAKESTKTSGKIISFSVYEDVDGMFIKSEYAGYWFDLNTSKFILVSPYSTDLISISPLSNQLLFKNSKEIGILTFAIEEGDSLDYVGKRYIWETVEEEISSIQWITNGKNVLFKKDTNLFVSDSDSENSVEIYSTPTNFVSIETDPSNILISYTNEEKDFVIKELTIH